jgi:hypothetical protein
LVVLTGEVEREILEGAEVDEAYSLQFHRRFSNLSERVRKGRASAPALRCERADSTMSTMVFLAYAARVRVDHA